MAHAGKIIFFRNLTCQLNFIQEASWGGTLLPVHSSFEPTVYPLDKNIIMVNICLSY
jgi:hypothetical protein